MRTHKKGNKNNLRMNGFILADRTVLHCRGVMTAGTYGSKPYEIHNQEAGTRIPVLSSLSPVYIVQDPSPANSRYPTLISQVALDLIS